MSSWNDRYTEFVQQAKGLHPKVDIADFDYTIYISPRYNYAYAFTPKAGCTTVKKLLTDAEFAEPQAYTDVEYLHYREFLPFLKPSQVGDPKVFFQRKDIFKFCFVRHPYSRLLSGYLDKVVGRKPQRDSILATLGKDQTYEPTFAEFIKAVCAQPVHKQDQHWRVQYYLTYQMGIDYDFIGRFENLRHDVSQVAEQLGILSFLTEDILGSPTQQAMGQHHATGADALVEKYYDASLKRMVQRAFEEDFEFFGYAP